MKNILLVRQGDIQMYVVVGLYSFPSLHYLAQVRKQGAPHMC